MTNQVATPNLNQDTEYMLCEMCEDRFGKRETYLGAVASRSDGSFRAFEETRLLAQKIYSPVSQLDASRLDCEKIVYFGASILWRAAVSRTKTYSVRLDDGDEEALRRYLLGETPLVPRFCVVVELLKGDGPDSGVDRFFTAPQTYGLWAGAGYHMFAVQGLLYLFFPHHVADALQLWVYHLPLSHCFLLGGFQNVFLTSALSAIAASQTTASEV